MGDLYYNTILNEISKKNIFLNKLLSPRDRITFLDFKCEKAIEAFSKHKKREFEKFIF